MALTTLAMRNDVWMDGVTVAGQDLRLQQAGAFLTGASPSGTTGIAARPGVRYGTGNPLGIGTSSGMTLAVNPGVAWVQGSAAANAGMYTGCLDTAGTVTLATSDPTNPRIDNIIIQVTDLGTSSSTTIVTPQTGTPAPSPVAPTVPSNALLLAQVAVGAGVSSISAGNITDKRAYTAASGGIVPMVNVTSGISGGAGTYADDLSTGRLKRADGSGNARQPKVGAFAATSQNVSTPVATTTAGSTTVASVTVTTDGATEVEIYAGWLSLNPASGTVVGDYCAFFLGWDTFAIYGNPFVVRADSTNTGPMGGGNLRGWLTPAAGTHQFRLDVTSIGHAFTVNYPYIRVAPSLQQ